MMRRRSWTLTEIQIPVTLGASNGSTILIILMVRIRIRPNHPAIDPGCCPINQDRPGRVIIAVVFGLDLHAP